MPSNFTRRDFMNTTAAGGAAALAISQCVPPPYASSRAFGRLGRE